MQGATKRALVEAKLDADVVVIGAGLAGLSAAIRVAIGGASVVVIDRLRIAGGLCGTWSDGEFTFVRACNDFSGRLVRELRELGVELEFTRSRWRLVIGDRCFDNPPRVRIGLRKPASFDPSTGVHHVGNAVLPAGEHAAQAVLSGRRAAEAVLERLTESGRSLF